MGKKPLKKVITSDRPETDQPTRYSPTDDGTLTLRSLLDTSNIELRQMTAQPPSSLDSQLSTIQVFELPADTTISQTTVERPLSDYYLPPSLAERLPDPDPVSAIRTTDRGRQYVDLVDGWTVRVDTDAQGDLRARLPSVLTLGARLERVEDSLAWRRLPTDDAEAGNAELIVSRRELPDKEPDDAVPAKRMRGIDEESTTENPAPPAPDTSIAMPWKNWKLSPERVSLNHITVDGLRYEILPHGEFPPPPIVYVKNPAHFSYDFDSLNKILSDHLQQQPRGAIQIPTTQRWEIDPTLPFNGPLTDYVATYFRYLTTSSVRKVARKQFDLANGGDIATGAGLTTLRQTFNDWKTSRPAPRPEMVDPLLMLPITHLAPGSKGKRVLKLDFLDKQAPLERLEFNPEDFPQNYDFFPLNQTVDALNVSMYKLLTRNGYTVFIPIRTTLYPALVFQRTGHEFVFCMNLHRSLGTQHQIHHNIKAFTEQSIGPEALHAIETARSANKLVWLKGVTNIAPNRPDSVIIVRVDAPEI
ncbi:hypothetical protein PS718_04749 [Pseudomonas fluorescens]|uniref:Uncharacterized protein n=1 Tax=Pseudomonas fluorescens TaxID=294 RepID=A0A5E7EM52_PSEFL|nr:hypothetical protein [Pseudomonas fluorescens]VVO27985.1 hypothetical protein PS718_04749 [Pseudomonas fluorescens]